MVVVAFVVIVVVVAVVEWSLSSLVEISHLHVDQRIFKIFVDRDRGSNRANRNMANRTYKMKVLK